VFSFNEYLFFAVAYLIGSIPFGVIVSKIAGIGDITKQGSGNIGATNVARVGGKKLGFITFFLDFTKGCLPAVIFIEYFGASLSALIFSLLLIIGHIFPIFNKFKGGKAVATSFGVIFTISPIVGIFTALLWLACFKITKISSASALFSFALMPFSFLFVTNQNQVLIFAMAVSLIIYIRHIENIKRLIMGSEKSFK
jgi:glycerol-3-phosphate acyltransferase PlsY